MRASTKRMVMATAGQGGARCFFKLEREGWLIEIARLYVWFETRERVGHKEWAKALRFRRGEDYRARLVGHSLQRSLLVGVARETMKLEGREILKALRTTPGWARWTASVMLRIVEGKREHKITTSDFVTGPHGKALEVWRLESSTPMHLWIKRLGVSMNTYAKLLKGEGRDTEKAARLAKMSKDMCGDTAKRLATLYDVAQAITPVRKAEITLAEGRLMASADRVEAERLALERAEEKAAGRSMVVDFS